MASRRRACLSVDSGSNAASVAPKSCKWMCIITVGVHSDGCTLRIFVIRTSDVQVSLYQPPPEDDHYQHNWLTLAPQYSVTGYSQQSLGTNVVSISAQPTTPPTVTHVDVPVQPMGLPCYSVLVSCIITEGPMAAHEHHHRRSSHRTGYPLVEQR